MGPFCDIFAFFFFFESLMLVAIYCQYMDEHERDFFFFSPFFCGPKKKEGYRHRLVTSGMSFPFALVKMCSSSSKHFAKNSHQSYSLLRT